LILTLLMIGTLGFGAAGLCGAAFTFFALPEVFKGGPENYSAAFLVISVPSLLVGGVLAWVCGRALSRRLGRGDEPS
jgi:ABC-type thiamin/hydroxymethylpyrimidine transport system permease subunit